MFMEEVYPISPVLARKNSPACYHTGESFLSILTIHHPIRKIASYDAFLLLVNDLAHAKSASQMSEAASCIFGPTFATQICDK